MTPLEKWFHRWFRSNDEWSGSSLRSALARDDSPSPGLADDSNEFAVRIYEQLRRRSGNLFFSPLSVRIALAMAHAGARGQTEREMRDALCIPSSEETAEFPIAKILARLSAAGGRDCEIALANSLWSQDDTQLQREYLESIARKYAGSINVVNFRDATEAAREAINRWVADQTRQRIQNLLPKDALSPLSRLVLVNAIYFKAKWHLPFSPEATRTQTFYLEGTGTVQTPLMAKKQDFRHMQGAWLSGGGTRLPQQRSRDARASSRSEGRPPPDRGNALGLHDQRVRGADDVPRGRACASTIQDNVER